ncbi:hypothetical protein ACHAW5_004413 [Stephanodiscus triporus]|uniref:CRAL-TRIO domain-containing protein n=1 Tax=Stephanodiscus triporus TaxID=2934178 RepID=A0ABD3Q993_9STRA
MFLARIILRALALAAAGTESHHHYAHADVTIARSSWTSSAGGRRRGWHRHLHRPSIVSAVRCSRSSIPSLFRRVDDILSTRGGSTEKEDADTTAVVADAEEATVAAVAPDDADVVADSNDTSSSHGKNATEAPEQRLPRNLTFSATKPHDGSLDDPDGIPTRFLLMKKNNRAEAREAFQSTLSWRREYGVDAILARSHPKYDVCKAALPHYFSGRDPHGNVVLVQRPATLDFELMRKNNSTIDDLLMHYRIIRNQEYIGFGKRFVHMMSENYPGRSYKTLVINAPKWFHALYKIFKPVLRESTRQKIVILKSGEQQDTALKFYLGDAMPRDLISDGMPHVSKAEITPGVRYFSPVEAREDCEPGPNSLFEFDMRQFVSFPSVYCMSDYHVQVCD